MDTHAIASDAGSTDSVAAYLALGISKNNREAVKRDLTNLMRAQAEARIPLLIGSCGQAGGDAGLTWTRDIAIEIAGEPKIAVLRSELEKATVKAKNAAGAILALPPLGLLDDDTINACDHIVPVMGPEPCGQQFVCLLDVQLD